MLLSDILYLFSTENITLNKPVHDVPRLAQIYFKNNNVDIDFNSYGGDLWLSQKQIKKACNYLSSKNYVQQVRKVKCYVYNNKKLYVYNSNSNTIVAKEEIVLDFHVGDNYLMTVLDEYNLKTTKFPIVNNYHSISSYTEKYYIINNEISIIFKDFEKTEDKDRNIQMYIQIRITDTSNTFLTRLKDTYRFKQINNLLNALSTPEPKNRDKPALNHK